MLRALSVAASNTRMAHEPPGTSSSPAPQAAVLACCSAAVPRALVLAALVQPAQRPAVGLDVEHVGQAQHRPGRRVPPLVCPGTHQRSSR